MTFGLWREHFWIPWDELYIAVKWETAPSTRSIIGDAQSRMAGNDDDEFTIGWEDPSFWEESEAKCNECRYGHANATHGKRSYGYNLQDLPPLELSSSQ